VVGLAKLFRASGFGPIRAKDTHCSGLRINRAQLWLFASAVKALA